MQNRSLVSNLGIYAYAAGAILLGLARPGFGRLRSPMAARRPQRPLPRAARLSHRLPRARRRTRPPLASNRPRRRSRRLPSSTPCSQFLWAPKILEGLSSYDGPPATSLRSFRSSPPELPSARGSHRPARPISGRESLFARLSGLSAISFGVAHIYDMPGLLTWIPAWIPPSQLFWAYATTIGFFLAAISHPFGQDGSARLASAHR
jgi:hypothetical protein